MAHGNADAHGRVERSPGTRLALGALSIALSCLPVRLAVAAGSEQREAVSIVSDRLEHPPVRRDFASPDRRWLLVVETSDRWKTPHPAARLIRIVQSRQEPRWTRELPQELGPREAIVANDGHVLLVDEWINVSSRLALMLLDVENRVVATHTHAAVVAALGVPLADVSVHARSGTWLTSGPVLSADGQSALVTAGGRTLAIRFADGRLSSSGQ